MDNFIYDIQINSLWKK